MIRPITVDIAPTRARRISGPGSTPSNAEPAEDSENNQFSAFFALISLRNPEFSNAEGTESKRRSWNWKVPFALLSLKRDQGIQSYGPRKTRKKLRVLRIPCVPWALTPLFIWLPAPCRSCSQNAETVIGYTASRPRKSVTSATLVQSCPISPSSESVTSSRFPILA